ncbi:MAG: DUF2723 domain-containing protein, partial [Myxococcota bacterium]|nr:DUF2723 domain-containing protein [Myxococcota bacterium]
MGIAHPPGEPVWLATARLAQLIPVGDIAFRTTLLSAACVALCALPLLALCRAFQGTGDDRDRLLAVLLVSALLLGLASQLQALRAEVYGPTALVLLVALFCAARGGLRGSASLGFLLGLGAGLHPLLCVAPIPPLLLARDLSPAPDEGRRSPVSFRAP